jgi:formamidopyrimidine-DNA glycosylase
MPEGPEIVFTAQYLHKKIVGKYIKSIDVLGGRYVHQELKGKDLINKRLKVIGVDSKGKFMWIELKDVKKEKMYYILSTFGMTGKWVFEKGNCSRLCFNISGDGKMYYDDPRNFGTISITTDKSVLQDKLNKLGMDLVKCDLSEDEMVDHVKSFVSTKRKGRANKNIVNILMSQDKGKGIGCGIGNYLCCEILYEARIDPHRNITDLSNNELRSLTKAIMKIMKQCYVNNETPYLAHIDRFVRRHYKYIKKGKLPEYYSDLPLVDEPFKFKVYNQTKDSHGNKVLKENIYQKRTTWWVSQVQY